MTKAKHGKMKHVYHKAIMYVFLMVLCGKVKKKIMKGSMEKRDARASD